jgi:hypothetical protein
MVMSVNREVTETCTTGDGDALVVGEGVGVVTGPPLSVGIGLACWLAFGLTDGEMVGAGAAQLGR